MPSGCVVRTTDPTIQKRLNRSSPNFVQVTMSGSPTVMQNFITICLGDFDPRIGKIVFIPLLFSFVGSSDKLGPRPLHRF